MTEGIFMLLGGILIGCVAGYNAGRRAERDEPSATDDELLGWIVQRRMRINLAAKLEQSYRNEVQRELSRKAAHDDWTRP